MDINYRKGSTRIVIKISQLLIRVENQTIINSTFKIWTSHFQIQLTIMLGTEHITCTTIQCISDVWMCVFVKIQHHVKHNTVAKLPTRPYKIFILGKWLGLGRSPFDFGSSVIKYQLDYYSVN